MAAYSLQKLSLSEVTHVSGVPPPHLPYNSEFIVIMMLACTNVGEGSQAMFARKER